MFMPQCKNKFLYAKLCVVGKLQIHSAHIFARTWLVGMCSCLACSEYMTRRIVGSVSNIFLWHFSQFARRKQRKTQEYFPSTCQSTAWWALRRSCCRLSTIQCSMTARGVQSTSTIPSTNSLYLTSTTTWCRWASTGALFVHSTHPMDNCYSDKVVLILNVASIWGFTPAHYSQLQPLYHTYKDDGFEIAAFPCNCFKNQATSIPNTSVIYMSRYRNQAMRQRSNGSFARSTEVNGTSTRKYPPSTDRWHHRFSNSSKRNNRIRMGRGGGEISWL